MGVTILGIQANHVEHELKEGEPRKVHVDFCLRTVVDSQFVGVEILTSEHASHEEAVHSDCDYLGVAQGY